MAVDVGIEESRNASHRVEILGINVRRQFRLCYAIADYLHQTEAHEGIRSIPLMPLYQSRDGRNLDGRANFGSKSNSLKFQCFGFKFNKMRILILSPKNQQATNLALLLFVESPRMLFQRE